MHIPITLWRFTVSVDFVLFFFFLPAHHTSFPFFTETGYVSVKKKGPLKGSLMYKNYPHKDGTPDENRGS